MQWFISNQGTTVGPISAEQLREGIAAAKITRGMHVRDEHGTWTPIEQSPFAALLPGTPIAPTPASTAKAQSPKNTAVGCIGLIVMLVIGGALARACLSPKTKDPAAEEKARLDSALISAWSMSQQFVEKRLKSPGSADYGSLTKGTYQLPTERCKELLRDKQYRCSGWVDSQNAFGALVRTKWDVTVQNDGGDKWSLLQVHKFE